MPLFLSYIEHVSTVSPGSYLQDAFILTPGPVIKLLVDRRDLISLATKFVHNDHTLCTFTISRLFNIKKIILVHFSISVEAWLDVASYILWFEVCFHKVNLWEI